MAFKYLDHACLVSDTLEYANMQREQECMKEKRNGFTSPLRDSRMKNIPDYLISVAVAGNAGQLDNREQRNIIYDIDEALPKALVIS